MPNKIELLYPNLSKKAVAFTIDDGNLQYDKKFIDIVKPYGIKGTFNLCPDLHRVHDKEFYRDFYNGFDISNHTKYHTHIPKKPFEEYSASHESFNRETADSNTRYPFEQDDQVFYVNVGVNAWAKATTPDHYNYLVDCGKRSFRKSTASKTYAISFGRDAGRQTYPFAII